MSKNVVMLGAASLLFSLGAEAAYVPPPNSPLFIQAQGREQLSATNAITVPGSASPEGNWGILKFSNIYIGDLTTDPYFFNSKGNPIWVDGQGAGEQITAMFYGTVNRDDCPAGTICSDPGGYMDLYWDDNSGTEALLSQSFTDRTAEDMFTNFTDGTFLARLVFATGINETRPDIAVTGSAIPAAGGFSGFGDSYMNVDTIKTGLWTDLLNTDYFPTAFGARDLRLRNTYTSQVAWDEPGAGTTNDVFGADVTDPGRAFTFSVPVPSTLALVGLGALAAGFRTRRRRK